MYYLNSMKFSLSRRFFICAFIVTLPACTLFKNSPTISKPEMVFINGGTFTLGDIADTTNTDALPLHRVTLGDYYIGKTEVTYAQYDAFARQTGRPLPLDRDYGRGERAVVLLDWYDAKEYCAYFGYRLPSEAEWEFAARERGKKLRYSGTNSIDSLESYAITSNSNVNFSFFVATKKPNALGLYDMSGNVMEYVGKFYQEYSEPENEYPLDKRAVRILRGGSFHEIVASNQTFWRIGTYDLMIHNDVGFRCAVSQKELNEQRFLKGFFHQKPKRP